jgi:hypothetical protein
VPLELRSQGRVDAYCGDHHAVAFAARGIADGNADGLVELVTFRRGLDPQAFRRPALERPADQGPSREVLLRGRAMRGPGLEHTDVVHNQDPVGAGLGAQLVRLVEQIRAIVGAQRFADPGDVRGHLGQGGGELPEAVAPAHQRIADGGARGAKHARRRRLRRRLRPAPGDDQGGPERRHDDQCRAGEDLGGEPHPQYLRPS